MADIRRGPIGNKPVRKKRRISAKFYGFLGIVAAVVIAVVFFVSKSDTVLVQEGEIEFSTQAPVVVVRDEQIIPADNFGKANYIAQEGERVEADTIVAEVYKWGYNDKVLSELLTLQSTIMQYQENTLMLGVDDPQLTSLNDQIVRKRSDIVTAISEKRSEDVITGEKELKDLLQQKQEYLNQTVTSDQQLELYHSQESQLKERVEGWRQVYAAPSAGVVSYYFDGAESLLNYGNIENITSADLLAILEGSQTATTGATDESTEKPLFRLVNNFKWYILLYSPQPIPEITRDTTFTIAFDEYLDRQYQGKVVGTVTEDQSSIYILEMQEDIGELLDVRRTDAKLRTSYSGMKVPENAIVTEDGVLGVYVVSDKDKVFVPIDVKIQKDGQAIILPKEEGSLLSVGQEVVLN